ncbi:MAG TPA: type II toxin-antitoxin system VapC family toxin [Terriglobales bacterium]
MRLLLDSHTLLWWFSEDPALSPTAKKAISRDDNTVLVSAASAWEIAIKVRLGRLPTGEKLLDDFAAYLSQARFESLPISNAHGVHAGLLAGPHKDPFDRMLIAQAELEEAAIVSNDRIFDAYYVARIW